MTYTVNKLAKLSGVSVRTIHFYDEIGLLKPAHYGQNNYRYYEETQLLMLQQILFFRELGFQLSDIQKIISSPDFDKIATLESHKKILTKNLDQTRNLIETVHNTIAYLKGNQTIKLQDIFAGFYPDKQNDYEDYLIKYGVKESVLNENKAKMKNWDKEKWLKIKLEGDKIYEDLAIAINNNLTSSSPAVQALIKRHYQFTKTFWTPNKESYILLGQLYGSNPEYKIFFNKFHPKLLEFMVEAMKIFAERQLSTGILSDILTNRQREILFYIVKGQTTKAIAVLLHLSPRTVEHYVEALKNKLHCENRAELILKAVEMKLV